MNEPTPYNRNRLRNPDDPRSRSSAPAVLGLCVVALIALLAFLAFLWWHPGNGNTCCCCCQPPAKAATTGVFQPAAPTIPPGTYAPTKGRTASALDPVAAEYLPAVIDLPGAAPAMAYAGPDGHYVVVGGLFVPADFPVAPPWGIPSGSMPTGSTHVPEPSAWATLGGGALLVVLLSRFGRK